jgi:hypothetical protein
MVGGQEQPAEVRGAKKGKKRRERCRELKGKAEG